MSKENNNKKGCLRGFLIGLIGLALVVAAVLVGGNLYFKGNIPEQVAFDVEAENSFYEKANIKKENYSFDMMDLFTGNIETTGSVDVDAMFTSQELTAFFYGHSDKLIVMNNESRMFSTMNNMLLLPVLNNQSSGKTEYSGSNLLVDFNVRILGEDRLEVFANISEDISGIYDLIPGLSRYSFIVNRAAGANLYFELKMTYQNGRGLEVGITKLRVNGIPVPQAFVDDYEPRLNNLLNSSLNNNGSFVIDEFKITADNIIFKGKLPEYIQSKD